MSFFANSARRSSACFVKSAICAVNAATDSSIFLRNSALFDLEAFTCWRRLLIKSLFRRMVFSMSFTSSTMCARLLCSPCLRSMVIRPCASLILRKPSWMSFIVVTMSAISLSFCATICCKESVAENSDTASFSFLLLHAKKKVVQTTESRRNAIFFISIRIYSVE